MRILAGPERTEHTVFSSLRAHYLFDSLFCRPSEAHEKGTVENLVGYVRRNALVPVPSVASWDELNAHLLAWCKRERTRLVEKWRWNTSTGVLFRRDPSVALSLTWRR